MTAIKIWKYKSNNILLNPYCIMNIEPKLFLTAGRDGNLAISHENDVEVEPKNVVRLILNFRFNGKIMSALLYGDIEFLRKHPLLFVEIVDGATIIDCVSCHHAIGFPKNTEYEAFIHELSEYTVDELQRVGMFYTAKFSNRVMVEILATHVDASEGCRKLFHSITNVGLPCPVHGMNGKITAFLCDKCAVKTKP